MCGLMKDMVLREISPAGKKLESTFVIRHESPWETLRKIYECELAGPFDVAIPRVRASRLVAIRTIEAKNVNKVLRLFREIQHPNILCSQEYFIHSGSAFILHDDIPVSLDHLVASEVHVNETEPAAVLAQVNLLHYSKRIIADADNNWKILDGLLYLKSAD